MLTRDRRAETLNDSEAVLRQVLLELDDLRSERHSSSMRPPALRLEMMGVPSNLSGE